MASFRVNNLEEPIEELFEVTYITFCKKSFFALTIPIVDTCSFECEEIFGRNVSLWFFKGLGLQRCPLIMNNAFFSGSSIVSVLRILVKLTYNEFLTSNSVYCTI